MLTLSHTGKYWIKWGSTNEGYNQSVSHYDKNNIYISGEYSTTKNAPIRKTSIGGECQWIRELGNGTNPTRSFSVDTDSFGNVYVSATTYFAVDSDFIIAKYNSSGDLQWKKKLNVSGSNAASSLKVSVSNNIYICGWTNQSGAGGEDLLVMKLDFSGNILWQKTLGSAGTENSYSLELDSNENVIIAGYNLDDILIIKYNSSGTLQWQRKFGKVKVGTYDNEYAPDIGVDSSDNIYIVGFSITEGIGIFGQTEYSYDGVIAKYNSSGAIQWQKKVESISANLFAILYGITIDSNDDLYITGSCNIDIGGYKYPAYIAKLNSSGVVQWQRGLYRASSSQVTYALVSYGYDISIDEYGDLCIVGTTSYSSTGIYDKYYPLAFKVPSDGSLTGDYGPFQYGPVSLTYSNGTYTDSATSFTENTSSFTFTNSTLTDSTSSCSYDNILKITDSSESLTITGNLEIST
jgi:hypothetical protein